MRERRKKRNIHNYGNNADCGRRRKSKRTSTSTSSTSNSGTDPDDIINPPEQQKHKQEDDHPNPDHEAEAPSQMPEKNVLQLVIDILQRRDTYEIFAEPVDPNEVEDYYQIVKEPMDFGTMRAKLHEGMYQNLDQFKHDVFLITTNAMHFNSSATIYFRQARAIHELAKRIFHALVTAPQNLELKFSGTRRRSTRSTRTLALVKPSSATSISSASPKGTTKSVGALKVGKNVRRMIGLAVHTKRNYCGDDFDTNSSNRRLQVESDRRCTYRPNTNSYQPPLIGCVDIMLDDPVGSKCFLSNPLIPHTNEQQDSSYKESLSSFVKDLGPTAQLIATRKIGGLDPKSTVSPDHKVVGDHGPSHGSCCTVLMKKPPTTTTTTTVLEMKGEEEDHHHQRRRRRRRSKKSVSWGCAAGEDSGGFWVSSAADHIHDNNAVLPVVLALEHSHSHANAAPNEIWKWRNKKSCGSGSGVQQSWPPSSSTSTTPHQLNINTLCNNNIHIASPSQQDDPKDSFCSLVATPPIQQLQTFVDCSNNNNNNKLKMTMEEEYYLERTSIRPPFKFNLGFLKAQLYQMNMNCQDL